MGEVADIAYMTEKMLPGERATGRAAALLPLVRSAQAGDTAAFEQLMTCTQHKVAATSWRMLGNREDARDATQETFLRAYKYLKSFRADRDFHGWLYRIAVNVCRDMLRNRRSAPAPKGFEEEGERRAAWPPEARTSADETEQAALLAQRRELVGRALATLPEKERTAVVLRDLEGLSTEEVARLMRTRPATVRSQLSTGRTKLKLYCDRLLKGAQPEVKAKP